LLKIHPENIISYHTALEFYGFGHSDFFTKYLTNPISKKEINLHGFSIKFIKPLINKYEIILRNEKKYKVTSIEQTIIECLLRLKYCGGFEELFRCLEFLHKNSIDYKKLLKLLEYYKKKKAYNLIGFFLEKIGEINNFKIPKNIEKKLLKHCCKISFLLEKDFIIGKKKILNKKWNLKYSSGLKSILKREY
jgi:predicted transcriptional regulator of viral defense system